MKGLLTEFYRSPLSRLGYTATCRDCRRRRQRERQHQAPRNRNYARERELQRQRMADPDYRERQREYHRAWYKAHPERREYNCEQSRKWRSRNPEEMRERSVQASHKRRALKAGNTDGRHFTNADVLEQFDRQKAKCYWCGARMKGRRGRYTWQADHIVPLAKGGSNGPENIVCACALCNARKRDIHPMDFGGRLL